MTHRRRGAGRVQRGWRGGVEGLEGRALLAAVFHEFPIAGVSTAIVAGSDGNLWFTERSAATQAEVGSITPAGALTEFPAGVYAGAVAAGPGGDVWFVTRSVQGGLNLPALGHITPAGAITTVPISTPDGNPNLSITDLAAGPDGNVWFSAYAINGVGVPGYVGRATAEGVVTIYPLPTAAPIGARPEYLAAGRDGNLWVSGLYSHSLFRVTPQGAVTELPLPDPRAIPEALAAGPDGNLWVLEQGRSLRVARVTPAGSITEFTLPPGGLLTDGARIVAGPDGALWATFYHSGTIERITTSGQVSQYTLYSARSNETLVGLAVGPDGDLWMTEVPTAEGLASKIVQFDPRLSTPNPSAARHTRGRRAHHPVSKPAKPRRPHHTGRSIARAIHFGP